METCKKCGKQVKSLSRHDWKAHGLGTEHKPFTGKTQTPWNKGLTAATNESLARISLERKGVPTTRVINTLSEETKAKIARSMRGNRNAKHRGTRCVFEGLKMDSTWEVKVARYLNDEGIVWRYEERSFALDEKRSYRPDFFIYDNDVFSYAIEVKGYWREANKQKFTEFQQKYPDVRIEVWDKTILLRLGII